jgi:Protein kinase domain
MEHRLVDDASAKLPPGKLGRYEIVKRLATGGTSELLLARAGGSGGAERHVVIKQLREGPAKDPAFVRTFVAEARLAGKLRHQNICYVQDVGDDNGKHYVVMEYVHGEDLRTILARLHGRGQTMPVPQLVTIGTSVAAALHHAHDHMGADHKSRGLVHGDVTPTNILVGYDGIVKVVDFGIARAAIEAFELEAGGLKGKVPYMAPEQCTGQGVDRRSDVFALGIVLYELATGRRLFKGESDFVTMATIVGGTVPRPSQHRKDLPDELESILLKALARSPADRYQTAADLRMALDVFAAKARPTGPAPTLADYMTQLFVKRQEPWLDRTERTVAALDFDGAVTGLAQAPAEAVEMFAIPDAATDDSPIAHAHAHVVDKPTEVVAIARKPVALGSFVQRPRSDTGGKTPRPEVSAKPPRPKAVTAGPLVQRPRPDTNGKTPRPELDDQTPRPGADDRTPRPEAITAGPLVQRPRPDTNGKTPRPELSDKPLTPDANTKAARPDATEKPALPSVLKSDARPARTAGNRLPSPTQPPTPRPRTPSVVATPAGATPIVAPPVVTPPVVAPPVVAPPVVAPPVVAPPVVAAPDEARSERNRLSTDVSEPTKVAAPPPPPPNASSGGFAARKGGNDSTQVVPPLPSPVAPAPRSSTAPALAASATAAAETAEMATANRRKWIMRGLIGGAGVVAVILVVAIGFSNGDATPASPPAASAPSAATPVQAPPPAPEPPRPERTMRNSEPPAADVTATAPADPPPEPPRPERTMRNSEPPPADVTATAPADPSPEPPRPERTMRNSEPPPAADVTATEPPRPERTMRNSEPPPAADVAAKAPAERSPGATRPPTPSRPPAEIAPAPPKRPSPTAVARKPAPVAAPAAKAPVAKAPVKPAAKPPTKPAKSPAYDPDALFLKKP